jgi:ATP synthase protein I
MAGAKTPGRREGDRDTETIRNRLDNLERRLGGIRAGRNGPEAEVPEGRGNAFGKALRLSTELIAGVAVGGFIGWALDVWLGTKPFLMLGAAAGILNVVRAAKAMQEQAGPYAGQDLPTTVEDDD